MLVKIESHACGHSGERNLTNASGQEPSGNSLKKSITYWSTKDCTDCWKTAKQEATATSLEQFGTLPDLVGSERQVGWAVRIREMQLVKVGELFADLETKRASTYLGDQVVEVNEIMADRKAKVSLLTTVTDAKFWIDTRDEDEQVLLGITTGFDHSVKFNLEAGKITLGQRSKQKQIEYRTKRDYFNRWGERVPSGGLRSIMVGGNKFYDREVI